MSVQTPNMQLTKSTVGVDNGTAWEQNLNSSLDRIDAHDHTSGNGMQIGVTGININGSLNFNNYPALSLQGITFTQQASLSTLNSIFVGTDGNLYFNDGAGDASIKMTSGGAVNATSSGISSGSAAASFSGSVLVVNQASNTPANIQAGSLLIGNNVAASKFVTLSAPSALGSNYSLTLPALPGASGNFVTVDTSGNMSATVGVDNSTLQVSSSAVGIKDAGVAQQKAAIRVPGFGAGSANNYGYAGSSGNFFTQSTTVVVVTNQSVNLVTHGNPVELKFVPDGTGNVGYVGATSSPASNPNPIVCSAIFYWYRDGSPIATMQAGATNLYSSSAAFAFIPPGSLNFLDIGAAPGTHTYQLFAKVPNASTGGNNYFALAQYSFMICYEIF